MSNHPSTDRPTASYPTRRSILRASGASGTRPLTGQSPFAGWRDQAPTELLPVVADRRTERRELRHPRLRAALAGIALAAILLGALQAYAAAGIASARQAALQSAQSPMSGQAASMSDRTLGRASNVRSDISPGWVTEDTGAPYDRTNPHASPLRDLPRCTTSPDTPLPCLATISPDSRRAVVLEEDASLTALVRR